MATKRRKAPTVSQSPKPISLPKEEIEKIAERIAADVGYSHKSDLNQLISEIGGKVSIKDFWKLDGTSDESIIVRPNGKFEIFVPPHTSPERDRFTVAHELGHYVLHFLLAPNMKKGIRFSASRYGSHKVEWEANWFAAGFLMPRQGFRQVFKRNNGNIGRIADYFQVSNAAAYVRAKSLGLGGDVGD